MIKKREEVYQILELGKHEKNLHHKKGFGGLLFIDLSMIKFSKLSSYIRQLDKENQKYKEVIDKAIEYIKENVYEENNGCGYYWWEITNKDELLDILKEVE